MKIAPFFFARAFGAREIILLLFCWPRARKQVVRMCVHLEACWFCLVLSLSALFPFGIELQLGEIKLIVCFLKLNLKNVKQRLWGTMQPRKHEQITACKTLYVPLQESSWDRMVIMWTSQVQQCWIYLLLQWSCRYKPKNREES